MVASHDAGRIAEQSRFKDFVVSRVTASELRLANRNPFGHGDQVGEKGNSAFYGRVTIEFRLEEPTVHLREGVVREQQDTAGVMNSVEHLLRLATVP